MGSLSYLIKGAFAIALLFSSLQAEEISEVRKKQILHLAKTESYGSCIALYYEHKEELARHDFQVLEEIATSWITEKARNKKNSQRALGLFAHHLSGLKVPIDILEKAITSEDALLQRIGITYVANMQEDYCDALLNKAMSSQFLENRLEAAYHLSMRKAPTATGQIESLMHRLPAQLQCFFPQFFALIGTPEATHILRHLMHAEGPTKIAAILEAATHQRDDLLPEIRSFATHQDYIELEASAKALGMLSDMLSIKKLKKLANHSSANVQLAALWALHTLGEPSAASSIATLAREGNLIAVSLLAKVDGYENVLIPFLEHKDMQMRFTAALTLLKKKNPRALPALMPFLIKDEKDLGFHPHYTMGKGFQIWKVIPSASQHNKEYFFDIEEFSLMVREEIVHLTAFLPEDDLLWLAKKLFTAKQNDLVPSVVSLLEASPSNKTLAFLKTQTLSVGAPSIRSYCNLSLFKGGEDSPYEEATIQFLKDNRSKELIRLRPTMPWNIQVKSGFELTPEESSHLLIQSYLAVAEKNGNKGIDLLLEAIDKGLDDNRVVLSAILLHILH